MAIKLENIYGDVYYMREERTGNACGVDYTEIYLYSEELGEKYGTIYRNAVNDEQPNVWTPYTLTETTLITYNDRHRQLAYEYKIV